MDTLVLTSPSTDPVGNLALEHYLMRELPPGSIMLYLWQNDASVMMGKLQNCYNSVNVPRINADRISLVRRLSGGGATYQDMGNLNYSFIAGTSIFDALRQLDTVADALAYYGVELRPDCRGDLYAGGKRVSITSFYQCGGVKCLQGSLSVEVDMGNIATYVGGTPDVVNIRELEWRATVEGIKRRMIQCFEENYNCAPRHMTVAFHRFAPLLGMFSDKQFIFGESFPFTRRMRGDSPIGLIDLQLLVTGGGIAGCKVYSDAKEVDLLEDFSRAIIACEYRADSMIASLKRMRTGSEEERGILARFINDTFDYQR